MSAQVAVTQAIAAPAASSAFRLVMSTAAKVKVDILTGPAFNNIRKGSIAVKMWDEWQEGPNGGWWRLVACDWLKRGGVKEVWRCEIPPPNKRRAMKALKATTAMKAMKTQRPLAMNAMKAVKAKRPQAMQATKTPKANAKK